MLYLIHFNMGLFLERHKYNEKIKSFNSFRLNFLLNLLQELTQQHFL